MVLNEVRGSHGKPFFVLHRSGRALSFFLYDDKLLGLGITCGHIAHYSADLCQQKSIKESV